MADTRNKKTTPMQKGKPMNKSDHPTAPPELCEEELQAMMLTYGPASSEVKERWEYIKKASAEVDSWSPELRAELGYRPAPEAKAWDRSASDPLTVEDVERCRQITNSRSYNPLSEPETKACECTGTVNRLCPRHGVKCKACCDTGVGWGFDKCEVCGGTPTPAEGLREAAWLYLEAMNDKWDDEILEAMPAKRSSHRLITRAMIGFAAELVSAAIDKFIADVEAEVERSDEPGSGDYGYSRAMRSVAERRKLNAPTKMD